MIKIFRHLRKDFMESGKTWKYLTYALGEIILVVVGILIALQVNNWNEARKRDIESDRIMQVLHSEFTDNRKVLKERIKDLDEANVYVGATLRLMNKDSAALQKVNIEKILSKSLKYGNYNPANSTLKELISSGKLDLVRDEALKKKLFDWLQLLEDTDEDFKNQDQQATTLLIPFLYKHISMQNLNKYNDLEVEDASELFDGDYYRVFHSLQFENLYQGKLFWNSIMLAHYEALDSLALEIVNKTR
jgi:hypothetical protein